MSEPNEWKTDARSAVKHCERMYAETQNTYYVLMALSAARSVDDEPPQWALDVLLEAVDEATLKNNLTGARMSMDSALGLTVSQGRSTKEREAHKADAEVQAFDLARTIHTCFKVSIPDACETAYYAVDFEFARAIEEAPRLDAFIDKCDEPESVKEEIPVFFTDRWGEPESVMEKIHGGNWWAITYGDRLGYSLDHFIDRYHRCGTHREGRFHRLPDKQGDFFDGYILLLVPERCTKQIVSTDDEVSGQPPCISAVAKFAKRPDFERYVANLRTSP